MVIPSIGIFILGAMIGSFLSVINYRIRKKKKGILFGRSECPKCKKRLKVKQLIPIFSYLFGRGKCMQCGGKISAAYPLIEIITGIMLVLIFINNPFTETGQNFFNFIYTGIISCFLIGIFFYDIQYMEIPEIYTFPAIALIFLWGVFSPSITFYDMAIGGGIAALFFGLQVLISKEQWLGAGDTQVGILMGLFFGWQLFLVALGVTYFTGLMVTLLLFAMKKVTRKSKIPFAPFLVTGTFITIFFGEYILENYLNMLI